MRRAVLVAALLSAPMAAPLGAQRAAVDAPLMQERRDHAAFLRTSPTSPYAALAHQPVGTGLVLGPADADLPIDGLRRHEVRVAGRSIKLRDPAGLVTPLVRHRATAAGPVALLVRGTARRPVLTVYGALPAQSPEPQWYPPAPRERQIVTLVPSAARTPLTLLDSDGIDAEAAEAGIVVLASGDTLRVRRLAIGEDESELEIFFRDATNGTSTYPAGRFITLSATRDGRYLLDFNRARSPSCAYSTIFPCPAPWPGNTLARAVMAGERYKAK